MPFDPSKVNWEDPRIAPHLQQLAESTFDYLLATAQEKGIPLAGTLPFNTMNEDVGNAWKACIILFIEELMPEGLKPAKPAPQKAKTS